MSAAYLYIFGWSQIKFSEVETEELRFGEQCVYVDAFNEEMALVYLLSNIGTFSEVCEHENNRKSLLPPLVATTPPCVRSPGCIVWRPPGSAAEG